MHPHFSILFLITFPSFHPFARADSQRAQDAEQQPETSFEYDAHDEWTGFMSLLNPTNLADKIQEASFISNLFGIPFTASPGKAQPAAQASPNPPDSRPEPPQRNLEALFSEETTKIIRSFETVVNSTITLGMALHDVLESTSANSVPSSIAPFTPLLKKVAKLVAIAHDDFRARFPLPATAPGHAERMNRVSEAIEHLQQLVVRLAEKYEIEQEVIERHMAHAKSFLHDIGVLMGDVAELYPTAIEALVLNLSAVLLPEALFLRSLVILYCFGPYVLGKDAISGWLLKHVSEVLRV